MSDPSTGVSRAWVEVDEAALRRNLRRVKDAAGPGAALVPMLKANAYGLGVAAVLRMVRAELAPGELFAVGVAAVAEGEELRALGWTGRVVVFAPAPPGELARAARAGLTPALSDLDGVRRWAAAARDQGRRLAFHAEVDTGMGRAGFPYADAAAWGGAVEAIAADLLEWEGCFTHFHSADEPELAPTDEQQRRFARALEALPPPRGGAVRRVVHSANSAASVRRQGYGGDLVRPGIFLYGGSAGPGAVPKPVVAVRARVALVKDVPAGWTCGYGATYTARRPERWGTLAIGYGDGIPRALSPAGGQALVRGRRVPVIGRISMDMTVVDLTEVPEARAGDAATLIGRDGEEEIGLDEVAAKAGTISYEILTGLGARLPRVYLDGTRTPGAA
ncbi:MAG: alanine racemase [Gemmatimonadetes bacterium]|nr:alanine racemase [Gemmatimonadota bacterium]